MLKGIIFDMDGVGKRPSEKEGQIWTMRFTKTALDQP